MAWLERGAVYLNKKRAIEDKQIPEGTYLRIHTRPRRYPVSDIDWLSCIVFQTSDFLIVNKPKGIPVHSTLDNYAENVCVQLRAHFPQVFVTHRLDVATSGLLVLARSRDFLRYFNKQLSQGKVSKEYTTWVTSPLTLGPRIHYMERSLAAPKKVSETFCPEGQRCELEILECVAERAGSYRLKIALKTGRTHQIRAQLSALGAPIIGDTLYGSSAPASEFCLLSSAVGFYLQRDSSLPQVFRLNVSEFKCS